MVRNSSPSWRLGAKTLEAQHADGTTKVQGDVTTLNQLASNLVDFDPRESALQESMRLTSWALQDRRAAMEHYVRLDVSLKVTAICIVDQTGKIQREGVVHSDLGATAGLPAHSGLPPTSDVALHCAS